MRASLIRWVLVLVPGVLLLGFLSGQVGQSGPDNPWFAALVKPALYPPPATFGIVWSILYVMMGLSLALVVTARGAPGRRAAIVAFVVQLALNLSWSPLFFAARQITAALVLIVVMAAAIAVTIVLFRRVRPIAAVLLLPYLAWVLFATYLNWAFLDANPDADGGTASGAVTRIEL